MQLNSVIIEVICIIGSRRESAGFFWAGSPDMGVAINFTAVVTLLLGCSNSSVTGSTMLDNLQADEGGLENALGINLPVCYLDNIIDHYFDTYWRWEDTVVKDALNLGCGSIPNNIKH
ncbi:uncharacterized protein APUU_50244A [Aspergillus puulaauensis]|uniref:Uncharacterized protein n=1 Tax=Aspergillus puulaauensis TaxID=1220207 RepID=A0A7R7XRB5_9EURO|nr:uncharacterized protein APUU_50244A [Aspergillus puulaauensis]BCS25533.1 hypothetical protein APUU_50244A [Aspergillus puulaauensis]